MAWTPMKGSRFKKDQPARLRLSTGKIVTAFYHDCEELRDDTPDGDIEDCFITGWGDGGEMIELSEIESWKPATEKQVIHADRTPN